MQVKRLDAEHQPRLEDRARRMIMMIGTDLSTKGGVSAVVRGYYQFGIMSRFGIRYFATHRDGSRIDKIIFYIRGFIRILFNIAHFDIVHLHLSSRWSFRRLLPIIILAKLLRKKVVLHLHGGRFPTYYQKSNLLEKSLIRLGFYLSDRVVVLSMSWIKRVNSFCSLNKIVIIPNSVPLNALAENWREKKIHKPHTLLFMGKLTAAKGVYDLLDAMKELGSGSSESKLLICGDGDISKVKHSVEILGLEGVVHIMGWVGGEEKRRLLEDAYLSILPSYQEGLPMSILEAMAYGIPVIATPVGGIPDIIKDGCNGYLVPPGSPQQIAEKIQVLLKEKELWFRMSENARKTIEERFCMEEIETKLGDLYNQIGATP